MRTKDFYFDLPGELIAQEPSSRRGEDRLLVLDRPTGSVADRRFSEIAEIVEPGTVMVFNDSRVRRARVFATAESSGNRAEFLLIGRREADGSPPGSRWKAMARNAKRHKSGRRYRFDDGTEACVVDTGDADSAGEFRVLEFSRPIDDDWLDANGHLPLPPYIRRDDRPADADRYQTVYARNVGSVAAPTAGLHFTDEVLSALDERGAIRATVTLHVGLGTFLPVRVEEIEEHRMHEESFSVPERTARLVAEAKRDGRPVLAVGTTSVRTLESAWDAESLALRVGESSTSIFVYPGYRFKVVDQLFTNFHTPESTLLMLVSAFAGKERILDAYRHAIERRYRFFSYGDAMLIR